MITMYINIDHASSHGYGSMIHSSQNQYISLTYLRSTMLSLGYIMVILIIILYWKFIIPEACLTGIGSLAMTIKRMFRGHDI